MGPPPKKAQRKHRKKKITKEPQDKTIAEAFPHTTSEELDQAQLFYKMGLSANLANSQPGMPGRDKTFKIFRWLDEEVLKNYDMDANNRQKLAKQRLKESFERILLKLEIQLAKVEKVLDVTFKNWEENFATLAKLTPPKLPKDFIIDNKVERLRLSIMTAVSEVRDHIATTDYTLTIFEADEKAILEHLELKAAKLAA